MTKPWTLCREKQLTRQEWLKIFRSMRDRATLAEQRGTERAIREYVIVCTAAYAGPRRAELAALRIGDLHLANERPYLVIRHGKGDRYREVVISPFLRRLLKQYLKHKEEWEEFTTPDALVFVSQRGAFTGSGIARIFRKACARAGVRVLNVHSLRHLFGSSLYSASKDLRLVQKQLGHSRITTTQVYLEIDDEDAAAGMSALDELLHRDVVPV